MSNVALGRLGITIGMVAAAMGAIGTAFGIIRHRPAMVQSSRTYAWAVLAGAITAVIAMERALITRDFSVKYVAEHGSSATPPLFNVATMWSALEGSILLWVIILSGYLASVAWRFRKRIDDELVGWAMVTLFAIALFFFLLLLGPTNPFVSTTVPPGFDGPGPNPLLQNHILVAFHPPLLYLGYVGFSVPFAFAIGALITGRLGEGWLIETRRWTLLAWGALTGGIILGAWWSYEVLGWGGYWGWDPVEIASFMPWLTGTAFLHSVLVQERRGMLRVWNLALLCSTFALTIYGTFLTRSGVVNSVHAFSEGTVGPMLLGAFGMVVALSIGLIAWRGDLLRGEGRIDRAMSKEGALLANNILFAAFTFVMLLGTTFPLVVEALNRGTLSIGEPYFERMSGPIGLGLLALMAVAPVLPWRNAAPELLSRRLLWPAWSGAAALVIALVLGARGLMPLVAIGLAGFAGGTAVRHLILAVRRHGVSGLFGRSSGGMVVHLGLVIVPLAFREFRVRQQRPVHDVRGGHGGAGGAYAHLRGRRPARPTPRARVHDGGSHRRPGVRAQGHPLRLQRPGDRHAVGEDRPAPRHLPGRVGAADRVRAPHHAAGDHPARRVVPVDRRHGDGDRHGDGRRSGGGPGPASRHLNGR